MYDDNKAKCAKHAFFNGVFRDFDRWAIRVEIGHQWLF